MRIAVALSLLAVLCTVEAVPVDVASSTELEILRIRVREQKWKVETIIRQLELLRSQTEDDTIQEVSLKWNEEQDSYRQYETLLLSGIRKEINAAKATGKNVDECNEFANKGIETNVKQAYDDAENCVKTAENSIHNNLGFIDNLKMTGEALSTELDNIFLYCHDSDSYRMQICIIGELANTENSLRTLESDSITAEITVTPVSKNVLMQASNCIKRAYANVYSSGAAIKMGVSQCILAATIPPPTVTPPTPTKPTETPGTTKPTPPTPTKPTKPPGTTKPTPPTTVTPCPTTPKKPC